MAALNVLNPVLYHRLRRHFGEVRVTHQGEQRLTRVQHTDSGEPKLVAQQYGEAYKVRCCFCSEQSFQLVVNHMYGQRDEDTGRLLTGLARCFARDCLARHQNRVALGDMLGADDGFLDQARIRPGKVLSPEERKIILPAPLTPLHKLPKRHPARLCLAERGLDPDRVGRCYRVAYCAANEVPVARHRLIIPVEMGGQLRGWQSMAVCSSTGHGRGAPSTYMSAPGMENSKLLYNLDKARQYETAILVGEPADVWTIGPMALCPVGRRVSQEQVRKLVSVFRHASLVLLFYDREYSRPDVSGLVSTLRSTMPGRFATVKLPEGKRAQSHTRKSLREHLAQEAGKQGVDVVYHKRE